MYRIFFIIIMHMSFLLALGLAACQKDEEMHDLDGAVMIELREHAPEGQRMIGIYAETKDAYPCLNFLIDYTLAHIAEGRHLHFHGVKAPSICLTALGPARAFVDLGDMDGGLHQLQILLNEEYSEVNLLVSKTQVSVNIVSMEPGSLEFSEHEMLRLGDKHTWGYIHPKSSNLTGR